VATTTVVPLNTMLADLDESLRRLLKRELAKHGFDGVEIVFDAPDKEWSAGLSTPTVNLFLYDLREAIDYRPVDWTPEADNNGRRDLRPPLRVDASYAVTGWTRDVQDEHRLLSQIMAIMYAFPELPSDILNGTLMSQDLERFPLKTRVAQARQDAKSDFWTAVGGQYKASIDYIVTVSCESGTVLERGPQTRMQTVYILDKDVPTRRLAELNRVGGIVSDAEGEPVANAWVVLTGVGWAASDANGRFIFNRVPVGEYTCLARGPDGAEAQAKLSVPGGRLDLTLGSARGRKAGKTGSAKSS
jgi:Pvc16 N-terminal domain/Carboxypeptidase regulatory-like domain